MYLVLPKIPLVVNDGNLNTSHKVTKSHTQFMGVFNKTDMTVKLNHWEVIYGFVSNRVLNLAQSFTQGSHFSGLTKFPDFSSIFCHFFSILLVFFLTENLIHFSK